MKNRIIKIGFIGLLFIALIVIRYFESYFYDPLQTYFTHDYLQTKSPDINTLKLLINLFIRFSLNSLISLLIIWIAFKNKSYVKFSTYFFIFAFIVLMISFWLALQTRFEDYYLFGFYIRRLLIHPIFILLLLPAFYYQNRVLKSNSF